MVRGLAELHHLVAFCGEIRFVHGKSRKKHVLRRCKISERIESAPEKDGPFEY